MSLEKYIDFGKLDFQAFEELCFELLLLSDFKKITWRLGGSDSGRDIEAVRLQENPIIGNYEESYFFECKKYDKGVPPAELFSKIAWADAEKPQHLVFIISSHISNGGREWLNKVKKDKPYQIHILEGKLLSKLLLKHQGLISKYFIDDKYYRLLTETIEKVIIFNLTPNFYTYVHMLENLEKQNLHMKEIVFLYLIYFTQHSRLEELENQFYHGIDISKDLQEMTNLIIKANERTESLSSLNVKIETLASEGLLNTNIEGNHIYKYDFAASEINIKFKDSQTYTTGYYMFRRISEHESIEILQYRNSSLEYEIYYNNNYTVAAFNEALDFMCLRNKYRKEIEQLSKIML